jgi:hypothetical protein
MMNYDRRVSRPLLDALSPGGWASSLAEYARGGQYSLDLQLRGYGIDQPHHWATLYVGLTKVLDLHHRQGKGFQLLPGAWNSAGWDPSWSQAAESGHDPAEWRKVEEFLEVAIPQVGKRHLHEGAVQSSLSAFRNRDLVVIDREAAISFTDQPEKDAVGSALQSELLAALDPPGELKSWWNKHPQSLGGECDALAVGFDGTLFAIEVKPPTASSTIPWAGLQVRHYARLFTRWAAQDPAYAATVINGMVDQRERLGLVAHPRPAVAAPIVVQPVLAVARGASVEVVRRLTVVERRLRAAGLSDPPLQLFTVNIVGRLDPLVLAE